MQESKNVASAAIAFVLSDRTFYYKRSTLLGFGSSGHDIQRAFRLVVIVWVDGFLPLEILAKASTPSTSGPCVFFVAFSARHTQHTKRRLRGRNSGDSRSIFSCCWFDISNRADENEATVLARLDDAFLSSLVHEV